MAIPKIIHYCWLSGNPYPELVQKCINSWHDRMPNYKFVCWDKSKIQEISSEWVDSAIAERKWAFAADYIRLYALYNYGGIYLDCDVETLKSFDDLLNRHCFLGRESHKNVVEAAVMGCESKQKWIQESLQWYQNKRFDITALNNPEIAIPVILKKVLTSHPEISVFPAEYFSPKDNRTGNLNISKNTYTIHHFNGEWFSPYQKEYFRIRVLYSQKYGQLVGFLIATLYSCKKLMIRNMRLG